MGSKNHSVTDLLCEEKFITWVNNPNPELDAYWKSWQNENAENASKVDEARLILLSIDFKKSSQEEINSQKIFERIKNTIGEKPESRPKEKKIIALQPYGDRISPHFIFQNWKKIAAISIGILMIYALFNIIWAEKSIKYVTDFGETKSIILPDSSIVNLNGNSQIRYPSKMEIMDIREIWLEGEAFFSIKHTADHQKFLVHISDDFHVEVLGTEFNISNREGKTRVVLSSGKIKLNLEKETQSENIYMEPGDLVEYSPDQKVFIKKGLDTDKYTSWRNDRLIFDDTSLKEIKHILESTYGLNVEVADEAILAKKLYGSAPSDNMEMLLKGLAKSLDNKITLKGNTVIIE
ncbi:MAG: FecR domain-containing protein [Cyclobacteriaceae bacterium]